MGSSIVTAYLLDVQSGLVKVLAATTSGSTDRYVHGPRGIHAQEDNAGNWTWTLQDGLGSVRGVLDDTVSVDSVQSYAPYGEELEAGTFGSPFTFTGEQTDNNGLVYLRARYYHPALGVFPSLDPAEGDAGQPMSLNRYGYVAGNVVNAVDLSGMIAESPGAWDPCNSPREPKTCPPTSWTNAIGECCFLYNRHAARDYAIRHAPAGQSHPAFCEHPTNCSGGTDCANFVSQAMLAGNHPMHYVGGIEVFSQESVTDARRGWACRSTTGAPTRCIGSQIWRSAMDLASYINDFGLSFIEDNFIPNPGSQNEETWQTVVGLAKSIHHAGIGVGDVLDIPTGPDKQHVVLIVGWGPPLRTWDELLNSAVSTNFNYVEGYVPYIVDHGIQRSIADQSSGRPYYFLNWAPLIQEEPLIQEVWKWVFRRVPDIVCKSSNDVITFEEAMSRIERE